jgi:hypothetical protein
VSENPFIYLAEAKTADAVLPNAAAGASAPMLQFERPASAGLSNLYLAEAKTADAVLPEVLYQQDLHTIPPCPGEAYCSKTILHF